MNDFWIGYIAGMVGLTISYIILMFVLILGIDKWREHRAKKWDPVAYISKISESNAKSKLVPVRVEDFDIDYNTYVTHRDPELQALIEKMPRPASFISFDEGIEQRERHDTDLVLSLAEELDLNHVDPARARHLTVVPDLEDTPRPATMLDLGGEKPYCGALNPNPEYPYRCTRDAGHDKSEFGPVKKHGYAGLFWD